MDPSSDEGTYIFLGLHGTGIPGRTPGEVRITEISMIAVKRAHLLRANKKKRTEPRVQHKFVMCFNPQKKINATTSKKSGFTKTLLKEEILFDRRGFNTMAPFINSQEEPVCLVAHNGFKFHFQLLQYYLKKMKVTLSEHTIVADSLYAFFDILNAEGDRDYDDKMYFNPFVEVKKTRKRGGPCFKNLWRDRYYEDVLFPRASYKLNDIYDRIIEEPELEADTAENSSIMMMRIATLLGKKFDSWVIDHYCPFDDVPKMQMG